MERRQLVPDITGRIKAVADTVAGLHGKTVIIGVACRGPDEPTLSVDSPCKEEVLVARVRLANIIRDSGSELFIRMNLDPDATIFERPIESLTYSVGKPSIVLVNLKPFCNRLDPTPNSFTATFTVLQADK